VLEIFNFVSKICPRNVQENGKKAPKDTKGHKRHITKNVEIATKTDVNEKPRKLKYRPYKHGVTGSSPVVPTKRNNVAQ